MKINPISLKQINYNLNKPNFKALTIENDSFEKEKTKKIEELKKNLSRYEYLNISFLEDETFLKLISEDKINITPLRFISFYSKDIQKKITDIYNEQNFLNLIDKNKLCCNEKEIISLSSMNDKSYKAFIDTLKDKELAKICFNFNLENNFLILQLVSNLDEKGKNNLKNYLNTKRIMEILNCDGTSIIQLVKSCKQDEKFCKKIIEEIENSDTATLLRIYCCDDICEAEILKRYLNESKTYELLVGKYIKSDGTEKLFREEIWNDEERQIFAQNSSINYINFLEKGDYRTKSDIDYQIEIIKDENGEPKSIIYTKSSNKERSAFNITQYDLSQYNEDIDVIEKIKNGTLKGGKEIAKIEEDENGNYILKENYTCEDYKISINYFKSKNPKEEKYSYQIFDKEQKPILNLQKEHKIIDKNNAISIINDKKYPIKFDNSKKIVFIKNGNKTIKLDIKKKFNSNELENMNFWNFIKTLSADLLLDIEKYVHHIEKTELLESNCYVTTNTISSAFEKDVLAHEIGHLKEYWKIKRQNIANNKEFLETYKEEYENFKKYNSGTIKNIVSYFFERTNDISHIRNISELIADCNSLFMSPLDDPYTAGRKLYLKRYFPKTVAMCIKLLNE